MNRKQLYPSHDWKREKMTSIKKNVNIKTNSEKIVLINVDDIIEEIEYTTF